MEISSAAPSHAWEVFPWLKMFSAETLKNLREDSDILQSETLFFALYASLFAAYAFMLGLVKGEQSFKIRALVFGGGALFLALFLASPVTLSTDVYAYGFYGRLVSMYGGDAYAVDANLVSADPFLALFGHNTPSIYGPFWTLISAGLTWVGGDRLGLTVLLFRGWAAGSVLLGAGLIWGILRRLAPGHALQGVVFFLWNPLVITEAALSGHNDAAMMLLVLLAIWLHVKGYRAGAVVALTLSALVKFVTAPLIPLYLLMILRESDGWGVRARLAARAILAAGIAAALVIPLAHVKTGAPTKAYATAPDFYSNNFHELIFKQLRRAFGEDEDSVDLLIYFTGWWVKTGMPMELRASPGAEVATRHHINEGERLLVMALPENDWVRVYDPSSRQYGYVLLKQTATIDYHTDAEVDPLVSQLEDGPMNWPTVLKANKVVRIVTCLLFAGFGLVAAWQTSRFERFLVWAPTVMLVMYYTVMTQIWPWYLIWALALGALRPGSIPFRLAATLSAGMLTLYCTISFCGGDCPWIFYYRSIPAIVIPSLGFAVYEIWRRVRARRKASFRESAPGEKEPPMIPEMPVV